MKMDEMINLERYEYVKIGLVIWVSWLDIEYFVALRKQNQKSPTPKKLLID